MGQESDTSDDIDDASSYQRLVYENGGGAESRDNLDRAASVLLPILQNNERRFFELVAAGDVDIVRQFLDERPGFNVNCVNFQGVSALHVAIQMRSEAMVELLLEREDVDVGDCALHAVRENASRILVLLLDRLRRSSSELEFAGCTSSSDFPDHVTPLVLAAQCGRYEIIELLLRRGHRLARPHRPDCMCAACRQAAADAADDPLHAHARRLNLYRAVSNPAYVCHSTDDPILTAFELSHELMLCARLAPEFRAAYGRLSADAAAFAVDLLGCCRSSGEVELVLRQTRGARLPTAFAYPRLVLAMDLRQKAFVAHPSAQQLLEAAWRGEGAAGGGSRQPTPGPARRALQVATRALILPVVAVVCAAAPTSSAAVCWRRPAERLLSHAASHLVFLALAFAQSATPRERRGAPATGLEPLLALHVAGLVWGEWRLAAAHGTARHFRSLRSWFDLSMLLLFGGAFFAWLWARADVRANGDADLERKYWHELDPTLVGEALFSVATIMAFLRLLFLCQLDYDLGPLQISLGKMSVDIARFALIFTVIVAAFAAGLCSLYRYYRGMVRSDAISGIKTVQQDSFVDLPSTLKTLFWALFCMSPIESADVVIEDLPGDGSGSGIGLHNEHRLTEAVGYVTFACFQVLCVVVILNMLIATMSNTFQRVTDNVDVEWTFGRMEVYVQYMLRPALPPPYNLLPTATGIKSALDWARCMLGQGKHERRRRRDKLSNIEDLEVEDVNSHGDYTALVSQLVQRYFRDREREYGSGSGGCSIEQLGAELEALRREVSQLRAELMRIPQRV